MQCFNFCVLWREGTANSLLIHHVCTQPTDLQCQLQLWPGGTNWSWGGGGRSQRRARPTWGSEFIRGAREGTWLIIRILNKGLHQTCFFSLTRNSPRDLVPRLPQWFKWDSDLDRTQESVFLNKWLQLPLQMILRWRVLETQFTNREQLYQNTKQYSTAQSWEGQ